MIKPHCKFPRTTMGSFSSYLDLLHLPLSLSLCVDHPTHWLLLRRSDETTRGTLHYEGNVGNHSEVLSKINKKLRKFIVGTQDDLHCDDFRHSQHFGVDFTPSSRNKRIVGIVIIGQPLHYPFTSLYKETLLLVFNVLQIVMSFVRPKYTIFVI